MANEKKIRVFKIYDDGLVQVQVVPLHTVPDNLHLSPDGQVLYAGTHPIVIKIVNFLENPYETAPSQVNIVKFWSIFVSYLYFISDNYK